MLKLRLCAYRIVLLRISHSWRLWCCF